MPSPTDFNLSPYYDDFNESKKFHRILFRPSFAVQARELTQSQSILQNQVERVSDHLFEKGAMVIPGNVTIDIHYEAVKLTSFTGTLTNFVGTTVTGSTSSVLVQVHFVIPFSFKNFTTLTSFKKKSLVILSHSLNEGSEGNVIVIKLVNFFI